MHSVPMMNSLFLEIAAVMMTAGVLSLVAYKLRQPLIIAYIATGILVGPGLLGLTTSLNVFETMSSIGIAFLLFIVGLNLNWRNVKDVGRVAMVAGIAQVLVTSFIGTVIALALEVPLYTSIFLGVAFSFSSTIIIVKLLTDKEDIDRLYGRIAVGMLIVQDLIAMLILLVLAALQEGESIQTILTISLGKGLVTVFVLWILSKVFIPRLFSYAARSQELLFLIALGWCFTVASALQYFGFGIEIGALLAGATLAGTGFHHEIEAKIRPLRDFFLVIFFIVLGTHLTIGSVSDLLIPAAAMSAYVLVGNPIIAQVIMRVMGYHSRTAFLTGTTVGQISEFSFVMLAVGVTAGYVIPEAITLATLVGLITIAGSSYLVAYNERIYEMIAKFFPEGKRDHHDIVHAGSEAFLLGFDRMGKEILPAIQDMTEDYRVIDFNPTVVEALLVDERPVAYGDVGSEDVLLLHHVDKAKLIVSTIPDMSINDTLLDFLRHRHSKAAIVVTVKSSDDAKRCYDLGATFVIVPSILSGEKFAEFLETRKQKKPMWSALAKKYQHWLEV
jgi:Kef-type K+ transport system membrane component KefB